MILVTAGASVAQTNRDHLQCFKINDASAKAAYTADLSPGNPAFPSIAAGCSIKLPAKLLCMDVAKTNVNQA